MANEKLSELSDVAVARIAECESWRLFIRIVAEVQFITCEDFQHFDFGDDVQCNFPLYLRAQEMISSAKLRVFAVFKSASCRFQCKSRLFHVSFPRRTDGVFPALTEMRVKTPWVQALRERDKGTGSSSYGQDETLASRDLTPKTMSESYHSQVCSLVKETFTCD